MSRSVRSRAADAPRGATPWVVLLCKFSDIPAEPQAKDFFQDFFTQSGEGKEGLFDYWRDMSGGTVDLSGSEVHGWFDMSLSLTIAKSWTWPGARDDLMRACIRAVPDGEVDFRSFYGIIAVINAQIDSGSAGRRTLPETGPSKTYGLVNLDPLAWFNTFAAHEMGHGYGLSHSFSGAPTVREYGDGWDIMSAMTFGGLFPEFSHPRFGLSGPGLSAVYRDLLGWIPSSQLLDWSSFSSGAPIEISAPSGPDRIKLVRVNLGFSTQYYAVELRKNVGWDRGIGRTGVLIRRVQGGISYLQQATSGVSDLQPGDHFVDSHENVVVSVLGIDTNAGTATVYIGPRAPATLITTATMTPPANSAGWRNEVVEVTLSAATVQGSQVSEIFFSATGANPLPFTRVRGRTTSFPVSEEGHTTVIFAARDNSGAVELPRKVDVLIDTKAPTTSLTLSSSSPGGVDIDLLGQDNPDGSGFKSLQFQADGANSIPLTTTSQRSAHFSITAPGPTTVFYWSTDQADNTEGPHSRTFKPVVGVTPSNLAFIAEPGSLSEPQTLFLRNDGQTSLSIVDIDTTDFAFMIRTSPSNPCGSILSPGATCAVDVVFAASTEAVYNASLVISTNASPSSILVPLTGTGSGARLEFDPDTLTFPTLQVGQSSLPQTTTVRNAGDVPLIITDVMADPDDYVVTRNGCGPFPRRLQPNQTCDADVIFRPRGGGVRPGGLMVTSNVPGGRRFLPLDGQGNAVPEIAAAPTSLAFDPQPVGTTRAALRIEVTNTGSADLNITDVSIGGADVGDFTVAAGSCVPTPTSPVLVPPEQSCDLEVSFRPTNPGPSAAELILATNVPGTPHRVPLTGTGIAAPLLRLDPTHVDFGSQAIGTAGPEAIVTLTNTGTAPIEIASVETTGLAAGDFQVMSDTCRGTVMPAGGTCTVGVRFSPTNVGSRTARLTITDGTSTRHNIALLGTGAGALVTFDPDNVDFGEHPLGGTERRDVMVRNTGNTLLTVTGLSAVGDFINGPGCTGGVAPGSYCTVRLVFRPTGPGVRNGELVVTSNALGTPHHLQLTGIGLEPATNVSTHALEFELQPVGTASVAQTVTVTSTGTAPLSIPEVTLAGAYPLDFRLQDSCGGRGHQPGASCTIDVVFAPTDTGTRTATLTIMDNAAGSPHTVALTGTAT